MKITRDDLAVIAMREILRAASTGHLKIDLSDGEDAAKVARASYRMADAMRAHSTDQPAEYSDALMYDTISTLKKAADTLDQIKVTGWQYPETIAAACRSIANKLES